MGDVVSEHLHQILLPQEIVIDASGLPFLLGLEFLLFEELDLEVLDLDGEHLVFLVLGVDDGLLVHLVVLELLGEILGLLEVFS